MVILEAESFGENPSPGLYRGVSDDAYHGLPRRYVSNSLLKKVRRSVAHAAVDVGDRGVRPALKLGRAAHDAVLRPQIFTDQYAQFEGDRRRKADKERYAGLVDVFGEWSVLDRSDYDACLGIRDAVHAHPEAGPLFAPGGEEELTSIWEPLGGVIAKSRFDKLRGGLIADLKTTTNAHPDSFIRDAFSYGYDQQAAFYMKALAYHGVRPEGFMFVAVEKTPPYGVVVYETPQHIIDSAWDDAMDLLERWSSAETAGVYPGYEPVVHQLDWRRAAA